MFCQRNATSTANNAPSLKNRLSADYNGADQIALVWVRPLGGVRQTQGRIPTQPNPPVSFTLIAGINRKKNHVFFVMSH